MQTDESNDHNDKDKYNKAYKPTHNDFGHIHLPIILTPQQC